MPDEVTSEMREDEPLAQGVDAKASVNLHEVVVVQRPWSGIPLGIPVSRCYPCEASLHRSLAGGQGDGCALLIRMA